MEEVLAWLIPSAPPLSPRAPTIFFFLYSRLLNMQDMQLEKGSQAAISPDMEDGWTAAKWRIMLMFVLIIQREGIHYTINR